MAIVEVVRVPLVKLPADMALSAEARVRYNDVFLRNQEMAKELKEKGHPLQWYPVPYIPVMGTDVGQAHLALLTLNCVEPFSDEAKVLYRALEQTYAHAEIEGNTTEVWLGEPSAIIKKYAVSVRMRLLESQDDGYKRVLSTPGHVRRFINTWVSPSDNRPVIRIPYPRRKGPPYDHLTSRREQQYRERWQYLYQMVRVNGYNAEQYNIDLRADTAPLVNYAMRLTKSLAILDKDRDEVITVCGRLDSVWQMLSNQIPVDLTVTEWEVPCVEPEPEGPDYLNEILSPNVGKAWMGREPSGFDRNTRRPQRNLPVLTIELPDGKEPTGIRHEIALHLEQIGFAVKFKN